MEGRLMLSATSFEIDYPNLQIGQFPVDNVRLVSAQTQLSTPSAGIDGGYINLNADGVAYHFSDADNSPVLQGEQSYVMPADIRDYIVTSRSTTANRIETAQYNADLQALRYFNVGPSLVLEQAPLSPVIKRAENNPSSGEGGAISIPTLVATLQHEEHLAKSEELSLPTAVETASESHRSVRSASPAKGLISGEWARAAMFETVSSERGANLLPDANGGHANSAANDSSAPANAAPVSESNASNESKTLGKRDNHSEKNVRAMSASHQQQTSESVVRPAVYRIEATDWNWIGNLRRVASLAAPTATGRQAINNLVSDAAQSDAVVPATDAMFDELGRPTASMIETAAGDESNLATRSAVPLLMILALERIATFNSRQAARPSPTEAPRSRRQQS